MYVLMRDGKLCGEGTLGEEGILGEGSMCQNSVRGFQSDPYRFVRFVHHGRAWFCRYQCSRIYPRQARSLRQVHHRYA